MADEPGDENPEENPENAPPPEPEIPLEDPNPPVVVTLNKSVLSKSVSQVGKTFDGLSFAFTSLTAEGKELEVLGDDIKDYKYLRNLSLAKNLLKSLQEVKELPYLLSLNGSQNQTENIDFCDEEDKLAYLQIINLSQNLIRELPEIKIINLLNLNLAGNQIASAVSFNGHKTLVKLELRKNKLTNFIGIKDLPCLQDLFIAENEITSFEGLENLPVLRTLHMRKNPVIL